VLGLSPGGGTVVATDSITVIVRQVARRVAAEPLRAVETRLDSVPVRLIARDARGAPIADATVDVVPSGLTLNGLYAVPVTGATSPGTLTPNVTGIATPGNNPGAPQLPVTVDVGIISFLPADTAVAGSGVAMQRITSTVVLDSNAAPAVGKSVRFYISNLAGLDSVPVAFDGTASVIWTLPNIAGPYTLTGVRSTTTPLSSVPDSAGRIVMRHTVVVKNDVPVAATSTLAVGATTLNQGTTTTIVVTVKDQFGNPVLNVTPADFVLAATGAGGGGTIAAATCSATTGVCTATYTAPAVAGAVSISATIGGVAIIASPIAITIN
jgi:hypothetical protein